MEVLDKNGLQYYWQKTKQYVDDLDIQQTVISETEPTDSNVDVWINPNGEVSPIPTKTSDLINDSNFATESWVNQQISNIQPSGSSVYETVVNNIINNGTTQNINIDFDKSYNELIVYIDLGGNNKQLGSVFWKINNTNANYTGMATYRYYHAKYTVTPLFTMFDISSSNNNQAGYDVVRGQSGNINKISSFSVTLSGDLYFPNGTKVQILGR